MPTTDPATTTMEASYEDSEPPLSLDDERFSRKLVLPAEGDEEQPFTISYSDFGFRDAEHPEKERVLLLCSPLLGSRLLHISKDRLAKKHGIRIICPDRPGFGSTTDVTVEDRIHTWLRLVPALLQHLSIRHVSIAAHSGGCIYALNTLLYQRHLLHPTKPYIALCAPWIHPTRSGAPLGRFLCTLPVAVLNCFDFAAGLVVSKVQPVFGFSAGFSAGLSSFAGRSGIFESGSVASNVNEEPSRNVVKRIYSESVQGLNSDARVLLKRAVKEDIWGSWLDIDGLVPLLAAQTSAMPQDVHGGALDKPLEVEVFFAESDNMIGSKDGPEWFNACWNEAKRGNGINYTSNVVPDANHDTLLNLEFGVMEHVFCQISEHGQ